MASKLRETIEATTRECILSYEAASNASKNASMISRSLSPSCSRLIVPQNFLASMGAPEPDRAFPNGEYESLFASDLKATHFPSGGTTILDLTIDETAKRSAARTSHVIEFSDGEKMTLEFAWFFELLDDGTKVKRIVEFCDPGMSRKHFEKIQGLLKETQA
ncbi:hypothetical protein HD806DRAFT_1878 [Xylariaceae sp. AK1471]|nr:hypothetical protein HD806DRAFT_1878 [Xylariaceae sp. AK1471]